MGRMVWEQESPFACVVLPQEGEKDGLGVYFQTTRRCTSPSGLLEASSGKSELKFGIHQRAAMSPTESHSLVTDRDPYAGATRSMGEAGVAFLNF